MTGPTPETYPAPPDLEARWAALQARLADTLGSAPPTTEALLLLIGLQRMGLAPEKLSKTQKQDLIQLGSFTVLAHGGYYRETYTDDEGWPHFELKRPLPFLDIFSQAVFVKHRLVEYFEAIFA
ncbi:MAG: hypothetical protein SFY70_04045 [Bacteroidia bacterium]|nr:hypothetical protein [Bacteroidia bacterium]